MKKEGAEGKQRVEEAMEEFIAGPQCRRVVIDRVMDRHEERAGCEEGEVEFDMSECVEAEGEAVGGQAAGGQAASPEIEGFL